MPTLAIPNTATIQTIDFWSFFGILYPDGATP